MQSVTVSTLNEQIKHLLETTFLQVAVEGEVSRPTYHGSGHVYFSIKDADSQVKAVMFRGNASKLKFRLEDGMKVVLFGAVTLYKPRGEYQLNVSHVEPAGEGNLSLAFKQLKEKLEKQGFFQEERKLAKPATINHIVLITSATGAALQDMLRLVSKRWPMVKITLIDVLVQGDQASLQISNAIMHADILGADAIVISRGGGSIEDLWAFNEENVANALFHAKSFTVSAVGHEIDWVISDYVADMRAATPTAAIELLLPDQWEKLQYIDQLRTQMGQKVHSTIVQKQQILENFKTQYSRYSMSQKFDNFSKEIDLLRLRFIQAHGQKLQFQEQILGQMYESITRNITMRFDQKRQQLDYMRERMQQLDPKLRDKKGFVQLTQKDQIIDLDSVQVGDEVILSTSVIRSVAKIQSKERL